MSVSISYDSDSRMVFSGLSCDCPCEHSLPTQDIYVGEHLIARLPDYIRRRGLGAKCVLVCDGNTYEAAGRDVYKALTSDGYNVTMCKIEREGKMVPDERAVGEVTLSLAKDTEFLIAVGSGSVTDVTRVTAVNAKIPFVSVGTAPSMDGYTSVVAPLIFRGAKIHRKANCPEIILCDINVMRKAPEAMFVSGVGDVLGKYIAKADWALGAIVNDEPLCPTACGIVIDAVDRLLNNIGEIRARTVLGTKILIEALLLAGLTIMIVGHTRAVASVEHNIAHYWDMCALKRGQHEPTHGTAVGIATLMVWPAFERFAKETLRGLDLRGAFARRPSREAREEWMLKYYGERAGREIMRENPGDFLTEEAWSARVTRAIARMDDIRAEFMLLPPRQKIADAMRALGAPLTPAELGIAPEDTHAALLCAKDYRERYTLFKLLDELGILNTYLAEIEMRMSE